MTSMSKSDLRTLQVGDSLPPFVAPVVDRTMLALFAGASHDHNPIHIDIDFARKSGMPDVFAHGMLSMAWLGRLLTQWVDQRQLRQFNVRFAGITHLGNQVTCIGRVTEKLELAGKPCIKIALQTIDQFGEIKLAGDALVEL